MKDIREYKSRLRESCRARRLAMSSQQKLAADRAIMQRICKSSSYRACSLLLCYVSTPIEVDTHALIERALADGKRVAVPRCVENTRDMEFFYINSLDELSPGSFSVLEPSRDCTKLVADFSDSICIVPGLCFDRRGYRLGYGKGYYDRFLSGYAGEKIGICYTCCIKWRLINGRFDVSADAIATETRYCKIYKNNCEGTKQDYGRKEQ